MTKRLDVRRFSACAQVDAYWESLRRGGALPKRSDIDPRGIEDALNYAFILESIGVGLARIRIAGMHLNEVMGMEVRGMPISTFFTAPSREPFGRAMASVMQTPAKMRLTLASEAAWGQPEMTARMVLLPLVSEMGDVSRVLGCFETVGALGRTPRRFDLRAAEKTALDTNLPQADLPDQMRAFAEPAAPFEPKDPITRGHLRLVKSDKS